MRTEKKSHRSSQTTWIIIATLCVVIIGIRLWLPSLVLKQVNKELKRIDGYDGYVEDIDLSIIAGSYSIKNIALNKTGGKVPVPFFASEQIDFSVEWKSVFKALFRKGELVGEIEVNKPSLNYVKGPTKTTTQTSIDNDWIDVVDNLMPLRINRLEIKNGEVHYRDFHSTPKVDIEMHDVNIIATNLRNVNDNEEMLPSTVEASGKAYDGFAQLNMKINPLQHSPLFDMDLKLTTMNLVNLNDFLRAYGNFDVQKGTFSLYMEAATRNDRIVGYAKPIIKDIDIAAWKKEEGNVLQTAWESVVEFVAFVFKNQPKDQLATQIEFEGHINDPEINIWSVIGQTLKNAFIKALIPNLENNVTIGTVKTIKTDTKGPVRLSDKKKDEKKKKDSFIKRLFRKKEKE